MALVDQDTFNRANQSGWGTASGGSTWSELAGAALTLSIASNEGHALENTLSSNIFIALGTGTSVNVDMKVRFRESNASAFAGVFFRSDGTAANSYRVRTANGANNFGIRKNVSGASSTVGTDKTVTLTANTFYWIRARCVGSNIYAKFWADGSAEPPGWTETASDSSLTSAGRYGLVFVTNGAITDTWDFDSFTVTDAVNSLGAPFESNFLIQKILSVTNRSKFLTRAGMAAQARSQFLTRTTLALQTRSRFAIRFLSSIGLRSKFVNRMVIQAQARSTFKIQLLVHQIAKVAFAVKSRLTAIFTEKARLSTVFTATLRLNSVFTRTPSVATPNTTIFSTATVTDQNGAAVSNLSAVAVTVTFPDGSTASYSLSSGVTNLGSGQYQLQYNTKGAGMNREVWSLTNADSTIGQELNIVPVTY